jgi:DNA-directed RNA polymerase II subunit RPB1
MNNEQDKEILETKVNNKLNNAATIGQKIAAKALEPTNNLVSMIRSGAKGNLFNICQVTGLVGQQNVGGIRMQKIFGGRTLPHYPRQSYLKDASDIISKNIELTPKETKDLFESRGFVTSSFFKGLNPKEFFFHAAGGREGLIDTACKTADTGYIQRKIIKLIEDCYFTYDGLVYHGTSKNIIDFMYGGDNMDASRLIKTSEGFSFIDISHTVDKLNKNLEWDNIKQ